MNIINQTTSGCYLLRSEAITVRTEESFTRKVLNGNALKIDGIYTYQDNSYDLNYKQEKIYNARHGGTDCYDYRNVSILINGSIYKGSFKDLHNSRIRYYVNNQENQCVINISSIRLNFDMFLNDALYNGTKCAGDITEMSFSLVVNTPMPDMDIVATKLVSY